MWFIFIMARLFIFLSFQPRLAATLLRSCSVVNSPTRRAGLSPAIQPTSLAQPATDCDSPPIVCLDPATAAGALGDRTVRLGLGGGGFRSQKIKSEKFSKFNVKVKIFFRKMAGIFRKIWKRFSTFFGPLTNLNAQATGHAIFPSHSECLFHNFSLQPCFRVSTTLHAPISAETVSFVHRPGPGFFLTRNPCKH